MDFKKYTKLIVCIGVFGSSLSLIFIRYSNARPFAMFFYRFTMTMIMIGIPIFIAKRREIFDEIKKNYKMFLLAGVLFTLQLYTWIMAIRNTSIASCVVISNSHPIIVVFISAIFLKEKFSKKALIGAAITVIGCSAMSIMDFFYAEHHLIGNLYAFGTAFIWALYLLCARKIRTTTNPYVYMFLTYGISYVFITLYVILTKEPLTGYPKIEFLYFFLLAFFSTVIGQGFVDWGLGYVSPSFASLVFLLEPVFSICLAMIMLSEFPNLWQIVCAIAIMGGIYIFNKYENELLKNTIN